MNFTDLSKILTKDLSSREKKENGIYFTPQSIIRRMVKRIKHWDGKGRIHSILEPSCGSGEFLNILDKEYTGAHIVGIELNKTIFERLDIGSYQNVKDIKNMDFLDVDNVGDLDIGDSGGFDLIIGNPPYFVMKSSLVPAIYKQHLTGRPNIFVLFILKSLKLLRVNGIMAFVLPLSFMNCLYYDKVRKLINETCTIISIECCGSDKYLETQQGTVLFIVTKSGENMAASTTDIERNRRFVLEIGTFTIFNTEERMKELKKLFVGSRSLKELGFNVRVGKVVWNQVKNLLTDDGMKTRLIYSSDIVDNKLGMKKYKNIAKKNYINKKGRTGLLLVVNRGYGKGKYKFSYCLCNMEKEYLIENHLICVEREDLGEENELQERYEKIMRSLENEKTKRFVELYFGNNAINTTELNFILPIY
jgi:adenine-specific DNA-methyltransferase